MNRILLTLLALLTGLVAPVASGNAAIRGKGEAEVSSVQAVRVAAKLSARIAIDGCGQVLNEAAFAVRVAAPLAGSSIAVQAVLIGIDRARE